MMTPDVYTITVGQLRRSDNQPIEMTLADLVDELEKLKALPDETVFQIRLAIMHREQEKFTAS